METKFMGCCKTSSKEEKFTAINTYIKKQKRLVNIVYFTN